MAERGTPDDWVSPADAPSNVRVTVVPGPRDHRPVRPDRSDRERRARIPASVSVPLIVAAIAVIVAAGAILPGVLRTARPVSLEGVGFGGPRPVGSPAPATEGDTAGVAQVAAAYRYPLGCLGITLSADRNSTLGRHSPCWRYGVYVTAVLRQVNGVWRLMLEATSPRCPTVLLPKIVRSALIGCRQGTAP
jgi:hypothetical protein